MVFTRIVVTECLICVARKKRPGVRVKTVGDLDYCQDCVVRLYTALYAHPAATSKAPRALSVIAAEIVKDWAKPTALADPYLHSMRFMNDIEENSPRGTHGSVVVSAFLRNARSWSGPVARRVKRELKELLE